MLTKPSIEVGSFEDAVSPERRPLKEQVILPETPHEPRDDKSDIFSEIDNIFGS